MEGIIEEYKKVNDLESAFKFKIRLDSLIEFKHEFFD